MTSIYGTGGAILLGVPVGFFTSVYLAKIASPKVRGVIETAVSLLAGIPSVVYGFFGLMIIVPWVRDTFSSLLWEVTDSACFPRLCCSES